MHVSIDSLTSGRPDNLIRLVGIARSAAESSVLAEKRRVEYRNLPTRKWLNRCQSDRVPFDWTINPYRGCEYGCKYCYARYTHDFLERHDPVSFETEIYAKDWEPSEFRDELRSVRPGQIIAIGTATDPYQPAERRFERTRKVLEALAPLRDTSIGITTKSDLVSRDTDLLSVLAKHNNVSVYMTVTTMDAKLARLTEPFAPSPQRRMAAVAKLTQAGIRTGVGASPILPLITDSKENLLAVAQAAKAADAHCFHSNVLFLQPSALRVFLPFVERHFPQHAARYRRSFRDGAYLSTSYTERMRELVRTVREEAGLNTRPFDWAPQTPQLPLF